MKSSRIFNNISDQLKKQIPRLKPGERVVFQLTNGVPNPEPDERERGKHPVIYPKVQLLTKYRLFDPYAGEKYTDEKGVEKYLGEYVDVGCVESWKGEEPIAFRCFIPGKNGAGAFMSFFPGKFELVGGNVEDEELFEILYLSPQRKGTPCPDASVQQIFEIVDHSTEIKKSNIKFDRLTKVIDILKDIKPQKAREVMAAINQPSYQDDAVLLSKIKEWAKDNVDDFIAAYESPLTPIKSMVHEAYNSGVLGYDMKTGVVKLGATALTTMALVDSGEFVSEFAKWLNSAENGKEVIANIKSQIHKKIV